MTQNTDRYRTYVTQTGFDLEALANQQGTKVDFAMLVVGDGELPDSSNPANQTSLINQVRHYPVTIEVDDKDPTIWVARAEIPAEDGGFTIRETGVKVTNESGDLYCYARQPGDYKPVLEEGSAKSYTIRLKFIPGNASVIEAKIDPSVQFATPTDLSNAIKEHEEKQDPHSQYLTKDKKSSVESAKTGSKDDEWMTPLTTHQAFNQFGLGKGVVFSGDDFHLMTQAGQFRFHTNTSTKNVPFGLEGHWFDVIVTGTINNRSALIAVDYGNANEPRIFHKSNANNVWSDWVELSHSGNLKLPIYPEINSVGHVAGLTLSGTNLTVANSEVCFYGWQKHRINPAGIALPSTCRKPIICAFLFNLGLS
ncbi:phage tail protein [Vibrio coralliilyticus]|uniref:phage tail-collar fiber domain-containing protein n=1 Tax=Vibrio coralliilyticus TaxID=190893 RepID=UPI00068EC375|nr:phage tail protein [Vibrio coralliilyticus]